MSQPFDADVSIDVPETHMSVDDASDPRAMTLAEGGDAEEMAEGVMGHGGT